MDIRITVSTAALQLLHEAHALVIRVSFCAALRVVILRRITHLPLHESWRVRIIRQTRPLRVWLLEACQIAHIRGRTAISSRNSCERRRLYFSGKRVISRDIVWRSSHIVLLVHETKVWVWTLRVLLSDCQSLVYAPWGRSRLVIRKNQTLVTPVTIWFFFVLFHIWYAAQFIIAFAFWNIVWVLLSLGAKLVLLLLL